MLIEFFQQFWLLPDKMNSREDSADSGGQHGKQVFHDSGIFDHMATVS